MRATAHQDHPIPATIPADSDRLTGNFESFADEFSTILSRQLDDE